MEQKKLQVVVRVRPQKTNDNLWVRVASSRTLRTVNHRNLDETLEFEFEHVFGPESTQEQVYSHCVKPLLSRVMDGQNASVFAYGPTGSGKTFTILGEPKHPGIVSRVVKDLFEGISQLEQSPCDSTTLCSYHVSCSYLEIYNEKIQDLFDPRQTDCVIREDRQHNIHVAGLSEKCITNVTDFNECFFPASRNRRTGATLLNPHSSRSHSLLLLKVTKTLSSTVSAIRKQLVGKMYVVDLAGSEDNRRTGNKGIRLKESGAINTSLFMLSEVVEALNQQRSVIPYRQSKLTRLLQDSLGGSAHSCMIVNVSPEEQHYLDTVSTLKLARKSKKIVNTIVVHDENITPPENALTRLNEKHTSRVLESTSSLTNQLPIGQPLLSPLIRRQRNFEVKIESDLDKLENRLLAKLTKKRPSPFSSEPDSTVADSTISSVAEHLTTIRDSVVKMKESSAASRIAVSEELDSLLESPFIIPTKRRNKTSAAGSCTQSITANYGFNVPHNPDSDREHSCAILRILNTGTMKEVQKLHSIGAKKAELICEYRQRYGHFHDIESLTQVPGFTTAVVRNFFRMNFLDSPNL